MENYKVKVNSEAESKEAQGLLFELGYKWFGGGNKVQHLKQSCSSSFGYLVAWSTGCFTNVIQCGCGDEDARQEFIGDQPTAFDTQISGDHYKLLPVQPMKFALANGLDYAQGNVIKYVIRHASKGGKDDLLKAIHNIELMIEHYYG